MWGGKNILGNKRLLFMGKKIPIGKGFRLGHGFDTIIDAVSIGENVTVMQQVTIGRSKGGNRSGIPIIGNNVFIGAGAKIIGNIKIGNNVIIGANACVTHNIPDNAIVGGIPAKIINYEGEKQVKNWCDDAINKYKRDE